MKSGTLLDTLAKAIAGTTSRRQTMVTLASLLFARAYATPSPTSRSGCQCNGIPFDPQVSCCTAAGPIPKNPIDDLTACPDRAPKVPPSPCNSNGCGSGPFKAAEQFGPANFRPSCDQHDCCCDTCNKPKTQCDADFKAQLINACVVAFPSFPDKQLRQCLKVADRYSFWVGLFGLGFYEDGQRYSCNCCGNQPCLSCPNPGGCAGSPCAGTDGCYCLSGSPGSGCSVNALCADLAPCGTNSDCPSGLCVTDSCCLTPRCAPGCSARAAVEWARTRTASRSGPTLFLPR
jgi:hypothetical protein